LRGDNLVGTDSDGGGGVTPTSARYRVQDTAGARTVIYNSDQTQGVTSNAGSYHHDGKYDQGSTGDDQWFLWSISQPQYLDLPSAPKGTWTLHSGSIYRASVTASPYSGTTGTISHVVQFGTGDNLTITHELTATASVAAMSAGTFFHDTGAALLYVWLTDSGNPSSGAYGRIRAASPFPMNGGIMFGNLDGRTPRLLCHAYITYDVDWYGGTDPTYGPRSAYRYYQDIPFAHISEDGELVMFNSNMGSATGRSDLFIVEVPTA
jgi:hypothetical protein